MAAVTNVAEHHFLPDRYHNTIGSHAPALVIDSGDTVVVSTVDAWGQDEQVRRVTEGPNPMSGPIFVRGAARVSFGREFKDIKPLRLHYTGAHYTPMR